MRVRYIVGLLSLAALTPLIAGAKARAPAQCSPASIGLARTIEIDTRGAPRFGQNQYPDPTPLRDREVVLTFDDGPHRTHTSQVLEALDAHCTKATFFMVGQRATQYPELVRQVASRGHTVGTHTWTHQNLAKITPEEALEEIELGISGVQKALGAPAAPFFRFPYLSDPGAMRTHLKGRNTGIFSIDVDAYDFKTRSPTMVIRNVLQQLESKGRGIILFHDIQPSTAGALDTLLSELKARGFRVVHMIPRQGQVTVAEFDRRIEKGVGGRRLAALPVPVSQRGIVGPAWEVRVYQGPPGAGPNAAGVPGTAAAPPPRPSRRSVEDDWRGSIFRGW